MKLHGISVNNFMSLQLMQMDGLDANTNFLVGPNGSGKTSVFRSLKTLSDAFAVTASTDLGGNASQRDSFLADLRMQRSRTASTSDAAIEIAVEVEFDSADEQEALAVFFSAALLHPEALKNTITTQLQRQNPPDFTPPTEQHLATISEWVLNRLNVQTLTSLYRGTLRLIYRADVFDYLALSYTFTCDDAVLSIAAGWVPYYVDGEFRRADANKANVGRLPADELLFEHFDEAERDNVQKLVAGQPTSGLSSLTAPSLLRYLAEKGTSLAVRGVSLPYSYPPAHRRLSELMGVPLREPNSHRVRFSQLMHHLLSNALVFSSAFRRPVPSSQVVGWEDLVGSRISVEREPQLPLRLYHLKNGNLAEHQQYVRIQQSFSRLVNEDISFDVVSLPVPTAIGTPSEGEPRMVLGIHILEGDSEISLDSHGAGIAEMLLLATLLDDSGARVVLLDEPAANLHPGMQRRLLEHLRSSPGQHFVITHSQHLLPGRASDFSKVTRLAKPRRATYCYRLHAAGAPHLAEEKLEQELATSSDVGGLLFATAVILVEGDTEVAALPEWFPIVSGGRALDDLDIALYSVGSKTNFGFYIRFLHAFGVPWAVVADGDALVSNNSLWSALRSVDAASATPLGAEFCLVRDAAAAAGVFTANDSPTKDFELILEIDAYIKEPSSGLPTRSKVRDGRQIGRSIPCPPSVAEVLRQVVNRFQFLGVAIPDTTTL